MMSLKGGTSCAVRSCASCTSKKTISLFRFPHNAERARTWLITCNRKDLLHKTGDKLHKNYRLCGLHFENKFFLNDMRNRLQPNAVPTIFPSLEGSSTFVEKRKNLECVENVPKKIKVLDYCVLPLPSPERLISTEEVLPITEGNIIDCVTGMPGTSSNLVMLDCQLNIPNEKPSGSKVTSPVLSSVSTQTSLSVSAHTPRKEKLRRTVRELRRKNVAVKKVGEIEKDPTLEDFEKLCDKFLHPDFAKFVKFQALSYQTKSRRYTTGITKNDRRNSV